MTDRERELEAQLKDSRTALAIAAWYIACFEDVQAGKAVRGLGEAKAAYESIRYGAAALVPAKGRP
jgi:hypothetical protein